MHYKVYIYVISVLLSTYALTGINFEKIIKKNKIIEVRILVILLSFIIGYLITNFVVDFVSNF